MKPPDVDVLTQWEQDRGNVDSDSWGSLAGCRQRQQLSSTPDLVRGQRWLSSAAAWALWASLLPRWARLPSHRRSRAPRAPLCRALPRVQLPAGPVPDGGAVQRLLRRQQHSVVGRRERYDGRVGRASGHLADGRRGARFRGLIRFERGGVARAIRSAPPEGWRHASAEDPEAGGCSARAALLGALREMGASVSEEVLPPLSQGDGWYSLEWRRQGERGRPTGPTVLCAPSLMNRPRRVHLVKFS